MSEPLLPSSVTNLVQAFTSLPGIGQKTARRLAFHLLESPPEKTAALHHALENVQTQIGHCSQCGFFSRPGSLCPICLDERRRNGELCVVGRNQDVLAIEEAHVFSGRYHVLGGYISPLNQVFPEQLRIDSLLERLVPEDIHEIVLAFDAVSEADFTAQFLLDLIPAGVRVSRLAAGIPFGGELEYTDGVTLSQAFLLKRSMH